MAIRIVRQPFLLVALHCLVWSSNRNNELTKENKLL